MVALLAACDDSSSASAENSEPAALSSAEKQESSSSSRHCEECNDEAISSDSNAESNGSSRSSSSEQNVSSSSEKLSETSSSSAGKTKSSSSERDVPKSYAEAKVMPSGTYDCTKYKCVTTEYLNQEFLESGKYGEILDERDGQVYKTVQIGNLTWMAQNLNFDPGQGGLGENKYDWSWCYNDEGKKCDVVGRLYTWAAAMDSVKTGCGWFGSKCLQALQEQGICPVGWHMPGKATWETLFRVVRGDLIAGRVFKSQTGWNDNGNGTDAFGFSALPAGYRDDESGFGGNGNSASFWSNTVSKEFCDEDGCPYLINFYYDREMAFLGRPPKYKAYSVRCVKNY